MTVTEVESKIYSILAKFGLYAYVQPEANRDDKYRLCLDDKDGIEQLFIAETREELLLTALDYLESQIDKLLKR